MKEPLGMKWLQAIHVLGDGCLDQALALLAAEPRRADAVASVRAVLRVLQIVRTLEASEPTIQARQNTDLAALLKENGFSDFDEADRELARLIRAGALQLDASGMVRLRDALLRATASRLRLVNPRHMTARQRRAESSY